MKEFFKNKCDKLVNSIIESFISPQILSVIFIALLTYCFNDNIIDKITFTQAKMLLQKKNLNPIQYQMTELWIATQTLVFLFEQHEEPTKSIDKKTIFEAYNYWNKLKTNWLADFKKIYRYVSKLEGKKERQYCRQKKELLTNLEYKIKCTINKKFEDIFFNKLENCYNNYYLKNDSCKVTLPANQDITELNKEINIFYVEMSKAK